MAGRGQRILAVAALLLLAACQTPQGHGESLQVLTTAAQPAAQPMVPASDAMPAGTPEAVAPAAYVSFCGRFPEECAFSMDEPETLSLTEKAWALLGGVNAQINASVTEEADYEHFGRIEYWTLPTDGMGDCEDFAFAKRRALIAAGIPARALRVALVVTTKTFRHAVLTVATDHGDYVLDNATSEVLPWRQAGYLWLSRQDPDRPLGWVTP
jgi:predicted transglutaminase-like cysteine proteinase